MSLPSQSACYPSLSKFLAFTTHQTLIDLLVSQSLACIGLGLLSPGRNQHPLLRQVPAWVQDLGVSDVTSTTWNSKLGE